MKYRFANCELDTDSHQLMVGGEVRPVEPQVFDLLRLLAGNPGRLVSHDDLIATVWHGRIVSESTLSARVSAARAAVGDDGRTQKIIKTVPRRGFRLVPEVKTEASESSRPDDSGQTPPDVRFDGPRAAPQGRQSVRFCKSADGSRIAYAQSGAGYPLVRAGHWLTHLEHDWHSPIWRPFLDELGRRFQVTRYDQRGNGLSDRDNEAFSLDRFVEDLEAVVDSAGLKRFALYGTSQGAPVSIAYAVRNPGRVSHLVLQGGFAVGRLLREDAGERAQGKALLTLIRLNWGKPGSAFIKSFASMFIPNGSSEQLESLADLQRMTTSPENAALLRATIDRFDVAGLLPQVTVPTLVLHARDDSVQPLSEGQRLASEIPGAEFVCLDSGSHVIVEQDQAWTTLFDEIAGFVQDGNTAGPD